MIDFWIFFIKKRAFTYVLIFALIAFGILSAIVMPKESAPEVRIPIGIISAVLPGAGAEDVEKLVTNRLEDGLANIENLNKLTSTSRESVSVVVVEFTASADIDKSIQKLKDEIDKIKPELPSEVKDPVVTEVNFADQPILIISISGDLAPSKFSELSDSLKAQIKSVSGVSKVDVNGVQGKEVQVIVNKEALDLYQIRLVDIISALGNANSALPVGNITLDGIDYNIKFKGEINDPEEIKDIAVSSSLGPKGKPIYVRDIAFVSNGIEKATTFSRTGRDGKPAEQALSLYVYKSAGGDVTKVSKDVRNKLGELQKNGILENMGVVVSFDQGEYVKKDLTRLTKTGIETTLLVVISLLLTIGWRESVVAALSIPLSFLIAFIGLYYSGNTINFVSLFSLILAIGILVDSGIVVTEAINARVRKYGGKIPAAIASIKEYALPLTAGTMTSIAAFVPLFFISGTTGKFIASIPFTVIFVLAASLFVALGLVPLIAVLFTKDEHNEFEKKQDYYTEKVKEWYKRMLTNFLSSRKAQNIFLAGITIAFFLSLALPMIGFLKVSFFPQDDSDFIYIEIEREQGSTLFQTDIATRAVEEILYEVPEIESFVTTIGQSSTFSQGTVDQKFANITINLKKDRERISTDVVLALRKLVEPITTATIHVTEPTNGPPVGAAVVIKFLGDNLNDLEKSAEKAEEILKKTPGAVEITTSAKENGIEFAINLDKTKATELGLNSTIIAQTLRTAVHGITATKIKKQDKDIDVVVKVALNPEYTSAHNTNETTIESIRGLSIPTQNGSILLGSLITTTLEKENSVIRHEGRLRIATAQSDVAPGKTAQEVVAKFKEIADKEITLPDGITMQIGGENEEVDRSFTDMFFALLAGMALMLAILVLEFNSFRYPLFLMVTVPLSLIGVFAGLTITGQAVSFPSILGFIALSGVIINHAIILLDSIINMLRNNIGVDLKTIIVESAAVRLRPIFLTTITTVVGVVPLTYASSLWGPLAFSIMFGLSFAIILTLILIPLLFYRWPGKIEVENGKE